MCSCDLYGDLHDSLGTSIISVYLHFHNLILNDKFMYIMKICQILLNTPNQSSIDNK